MMCLTQQMILFLRQADSEDRATGDNPRIVTHYGVLGAEGLYRLLDHVCTGGCAATNVRVLGQRAAVQCYLHPQEMELHIAAEDQTGRDAWEGEATPVICYEEKGRWSDDPVWGMYSPCRHQRSAENYRL